MKMQQCNETNREAWWLIGRFDAFCPKDRGFDSCFSRQVGTFGKSFTHSCLWRFGVKLRYSIRIGIDLVAARHVPPIIEKRPCIYHFLPPSAPPNILVCPPNIFGKSTPVSMLW